MGVTRKTQYGHVEEVGMWAKVFWFQCLPFRHWTSSTAVFANTYRYNTLSSSVFLELMWESFER